MFMHLTTLHKQSLDIKLLFINAFWIQKQHSNQQYSTK